MIIYNNWIPNLFGHDAVTLFPFVFINDRGRALRNTSPLMYHRLMNHEARHRLQWAVIGSLCAGIAYLTTELVFYTALAGYLGFPALYVLAKLVYGYDNNPFEKDAREHEL